MFGADTSLVIDAIQMAGIAAAVGAATVWVLIKRRRKHDHSPTSKQEQSSNLEDRVRVLERIATDRSIDLADKIEGLRDTTNTKETI